MLIKDTVWTNLRVDVPNPIFPITPKVCGFAVHGDFQERNPCKGQGPPVELNTVRGIVLCELST